MVEGTCGRAWRPGAWATAGAVRATNEVLPGNAAKYASGHAVTMVTRRHLFHRPCNERTHDHRLYATAPTPPGELPRWANLS
jgi:hypothetical protein